MAQAERRNQDHAAGRPHRRVPAQPHRVFNRGRADEVLPGSRTWGRWCRLQNHAMISSIRIVNTNPTPNTAASKMDKPRPGEKPGHVFHHPNRLERCLPRCQGPRHRLLSPGPEAGQAGRHAAGGGPGRRWLPRWTASCSATWGFDTQQQSYIKYGDVQAVVEASQPQDVTLQSVQSTWKEVTRLIPIPLQISGVKMRLPYPERTVMLTEVSKQASAADPRWCFGTIATPTPQLLNSGGANFLRETETKDFANAITSDLSECPHSSRYWKSARSMPAGSGPRRK